MDQIEAINDNLKILKHVFNRYDFFMPRVKVSKDNGHVKLEANCDNCGATNQARKSELAF